MREPAAKLYTIQSLGLFIPQTVTQLYPSMYCIPVGFFFTVIADCCADAFKFSLVNEEHAFAVFTVPICQAMV